MRQNNHPHAASLSAHGPQDPNKMGVPSPTRLFNSISPPAGIFMSKKLHDWCSFQRQDLSKVSVEGKGRGMGGIKSVEMRSYDST